MTVVADGPIFGDNPAFEGPHIVPKV